jgi:PhzF family phenazine biosynthesis protein
LLLDVAVPGDAILQKIAREMNLSETAFVSWKDKETLQFNLRWLTPTTEVNLCGHATLATAHILLTETEIKNKYKSQISLCLLFVAKELL